MKVLIDKNVHAVIEQFYDYALLKHEALDEIIVLKKVQRLYESLEGLGKCAQIYPFARLKKEWVEKKYREFICDDFHFAYQICICDDGTEVVRVYDACHSFLYTNR